MFFFSFSILFRFLTFFYFNSPFILFSFSICRIFFFLDLWGHFPCGCVCFFFLLVFLLANFDIAILQGLFAFFYLYFLSFFIAWDEYYFFSLIDNANECLLLFFILTRSKDLKSEEMPAPRHAPNLCNVSTRDQKASRLDEWTRSFPSQEPEISSVSGVSPFIEKSEERFWINFLSVLSLISIFQHLNSGNLTSDLDEWRELSHTILK